MTFAVNWSLPLQRAAGLWPFLPRAVTLPLQRASLPLRCSLCCLLVLALSGCWKADNPETRRYDSGVVPEEDLETDGLLGCPPAETLTVSLDNPPSTTCQTRQPFRGKALGANRLVVQGGTGASQPVLVGTDGSFCIEVQLAPDTQNSVTFHPVDASGCPGQSVVQAIQHASCSPTDATTAADNTALGATVLGSGTHKGQPTDLVDGKLDTVVQYQGGGWGFDDAGIRVQIALGRPVLVEKIIVRWRDAKGQGCDYGKEYRLATSDLANSGELSSSGGSWTEVASVSDGDGGEDSYAMTQGTTVQHVGLELKNNGCQGWHETFALREVEVWGREPGASAPPLDQCL